METNINPNVSKLIFVDDFDKCIMKNCAQWSQGTKLLPFLRDKTLSARYEKTTTSGITILIYIHMAAQICVK
jgi:hypothetical protein